MQFPVKLIINYYSKILGVIFLFEISVINSQFYVSISFTRASISKEFDLDTFSDSLLSNNNTDTLCYSPLVVCSRISRFFLVNKILVSSANSRN